MKLYTCRSTITAKKIKHLKEYTLGFTINVV